MVMSDYYERTMVLIKEKNKERDFKEQKQISQLEGVDLSMSLFH